MKNAPPGDESDAPGQRALMSDREAYSFFCGERKSACQAKQWLLWYLFASEKLRQNFRDANAPVLLLKIFDKRNKRPGYRDCRGIDHVRHDRRTIFSFHFDMQTARLEIRDVACRMCFA